MGKKRRGRCVKNNTNVHTEPEEHVQAPHSFVIHRGLGGGHLLELTKDFRKVMEPFTASALKERKKNTIKDFVSIAGPLHVSHLSIFSRTEHGVYLKICRLPRGPTLTFKIHNFSLARDVVSSLKKQLVVEEAFKHSPLIVLNSFSGEGLQMKLMASMFQNMFPTLNLTNVDLNTVRRCVLLNYNQTTKLIDFRHYNIKVIPVGISKGVKKVVQGKVPNLARCNDISELLTKSGLLSESEAEDINNQVTVPQKLISRGNIESGKSAIKLSELGPRLSLQLIKIEDGLMGGEVLYHDLIQKSPEEKLEIQKSREVKRKLKEKRKRVQENNKRAKDDMKQEHKDKSLSGMKKNLPEHIKRQREASEVLAVDDDNEYYREEVGEEPDMDLSAPTQQRGFKRPSGNFSNKRPRTEHSQERKQFNKKPRFEHSKEKKQFKPKKGRVDKTNSQNRDHRPIGGTFFKKANKRTRN